MKFESQSSLPGLNRFGPASQPAKEFVPFFLDLAPLKVNQRLEAWRSARYDIAQVTLQRPDQPPKGVTLGWHAGPLYYTRGVESGFAYRRDLETISRSETEWIILRRHDRKAVFEFDASAPIDLGPAEIIMGRASAPVSWSFSPDGSVTSQVVAIPAAMLEAKLAGRNVPKAIRWTRGHPMFGLLTVMMNVIISHDHAMLASEDGIADSHRISDALTGILAITLHPNREVIAAEKNNLDLAKMTLVKFVVETNLRDPNLSLDKIAKLCGMSLRSLVRVCEPIGGAMAYAMQSRLSQAFQDIVDPAKGGRKIGTIASALGFSSQSHFSQVFRHQFGFSPRDLRELASSGVSARDGLAEMVRRGNGLGPNSRVGKAVAFLDKP